MKKFTTLHPDKIGILFLFTAFLSARMVVFSQTCGGAALLDEKFENGIPANWTILDLDGYQL